MANREPQASGVGPPALSPSKKWFISDDSSRTDPTPSTVPAILTSASHVPPAVGAGDSLMAQTKGPSLPCRLPSRGTPDAALHMLPAGEGPAQMSPARNIWAARCRQLVGAGTPRRTATTPGGRVAPRCLPARHLSAASTSLRIHPRGGGKRPNLTAIPDSSMSLPPHFLPSFCETWGFNSRLCPESKHRSPSRRNRHSPGPVQQHLPGVVPAASLPSAPLSLLQPHRPPCCSLNTPGTAQPQGLCLCCSLCPDLLKCHLLQEALLTFPCIANLCLSPLGLLQWNAIDWRVCKQQTFISHSSESPSSRCWRTWCLVTAAPGS